jgi:hypothetical protein
MRHERFGYAEWSIIIIFFVLFCYAELHFYRYTECHYAESSEELKTTLV